MRQANPERVLELALPHLIKAGYITPAEAEEKRAWLLGVITAVQEHLSYAAQVVDHVDVFFNDEVEFENDEAKAVLADETVLPVLEAFKTKLAALSVVDQTNVQALFKSIIKDLKVNAKKVYMPIRVALTGKMHGPEMFTLIPLLGAERALWRLERTMAKIADNN